ncbi:hypothetical protein F5883DRAFT_571501 [Diaporthe sp. PMI_573]|nr:hypothetical protein F5883DRAFT_571501 [Diaporthaceae sp. PMI_573]
MGWRGRNVSSNTDPYSPLRHLRRKKCFHILPQIVNSINAKMTTTRVRFDFLCYRVRIKFDVSYDIPNRIIRAGDDSDQARPEERQLWDAAMNSIMEQSETTCLRRASPASCACGLPATATEYLPPMPFLDAPEPHAVVVVDPFCGDLKCRTRTRQRMLQVMSRRRSPDGGLSGPDPGLFAELMSCRVCKKREGLRECGGCHVAGYCGQEHQEEDWPNHKAECTPWPTPTFDSRCPLDEADDDTDTKVTYSAVFNVAGPGEPPRSREISREEVVARVLMGAAGMEDLEVEMK